MSLSPDALATAIGARVREQRLRRSLTLDQLAEASSLSRRMLVNVEQGSANPSVATLLRLAEALGLGLPELVEAPRTGSTTMTLAGEGPVLWAGDHGGQGSLVASHTTPDAFELWEWRMVPGDLHDSDAHGSGTRELLQVIEGTLLLTVGSEDHTLAAGDAISFPGDLPHGYAAAGTTAVRFTLAVLEPAGGAARVVTHGV